MLICIFIYINLKTDHTKTAMTINISLSGGGVSKPKRFSIKNKLFGLNRAFGFSLGAVTERSAAV